MRLCGHPLWCRMSPATRSNHARRSATTPSASVSASGRRVDIGLANPACGRTNMDCPERLTPSPVRTVGMCRRPILRRLSSRLAGRHRIVSFRAYRPRRRNAKPGRVVADMFSHVRLPRSHFDTTPLQFFDDVIEAQPVAEEGENEFRPAASDIDADAEVLEASDHDLHVIRRAATRARGDAAVRIEGRLDFLGPGAALVESFRELADVAMREEFQSRTLAPMPDDFDLDLDVTPPPEDDAFDEAPDQAFAILVGRRGRIPDEGIVLREGAQACQLVVRKRRRDDAQGEIVLGLPARGLRERRFELRLQEAEDAFVSVVGRLQSFLGGLGLPLGDLPALPEVSGACLALVPKTIQRRPHQIEIETSQNVEDSRGDEGVDPKRAVVSTVAVSRVGSRPQADVLRPDPVTIFPVAGVHPTITVATPDKPLDEGRATQRWLLKTKGAALGHGPDSPEPIGFDVRFMVVVHEVPLLARHGARLGASPPRSSLYATEQKGRVLSAPAVVAGVVRIRDDACHRPHTRWTPDDPATGGAVGRQRDDRVAEVHGDAAQGAEALVEREDLCDDLLHGRVRILHPLSS